MEQTGNSEVTSNVTNDSGAQSAPAVVETKAVETQSITNWKDSLLPELKEAKSLQNFKDVNDVAKGYVNLVSKLGEKSPSRPDSEDKYEVPSELGEEMVKSFKSVAFKSNLTQDQAKLFMDQLVLNSRDEKSKAEMSEKEAAELSVKELKSDFGSAYEKRLGLAKQAAAHFADKDTLKVLEESGLHQNPKIIKFFANLGQKYLEAHTIVEQDKSQKHGVTPAEAEMKIKELRGNVEFVKSYTNRNDPKHIENAKIMDDLYELAKK